MPRLRRPKFNTALQSGILLLSLMIVFVTASCRPLKIVTPTQTVRPFSLRTPSEPAVLTAIAIQIKAQPDVKYCSPEGTPLYLDTFYPLKVAQPKGAIIYLHGGGWTSGWKYEIFNIGFDLELLRRGYMIVSINYRLAPDHQYQDMLEDVKCAVRYLRAHVDEYQLDPEQIAVMGDSAGAYLAAMLGVTTSVPAFETAADAEWFGQDNRIKAVVMLYGPGDLSAMNFGEHSEVTVSAFGAANIADPKLLRVSPISYISPDDPPFLIVQASDDKVVPVETAINFQQKLREAGVPNLLIQTQGGGYAWDIYSMQQPLDQERQQLVLTIADFFDQYLAVESK